MISSRIIVSHDSIDQLKIVDDDTDEYFFVLKGKVILKQDMR